jgi:hypothetical protein
MRSGGKHSRTDRVVWVAPSGVTVAISMSCTPACGSRRTTRWTWGSRSGHRSDRSTNENAAVAATGISTLSSNDSSTSPTSWVSSAMRASDVSSASLLASTPEVIHATASGRSSTAANVWRRVTSVRSAPTGRKRHSPPIAAIGSWLRSCSKVTRRAAGSSSRRETQFLTSSLTSAHSSKRSVVALRSRWWACRLGPKITGQRVTSAIRSKTASAGASTSRVCTVPCVAGALTASVLSAGR